MSQDGRSDALLAISRIGVLIYIALSALVALIVAAAMVVIAVAPVPGVAEGLAKAPSGTLLLVEAGAAIALATVVLGILFALQLGRIIRTVREGDPFEPANADRLQRMAWLALAATVGTLVVGGFSVWLDQYFGGAYGNYEWSLGGLGLAVTLFILARVFRHGAAMRDDLAGTV